jgi:hypothetical protein
MTLDKQIDTLYNSGQKANKTIGVSYAKKARMALQGQLRSLRRPTKQGQAVLFRDLPGKTKESAGHGGQGSFALPTMRGGFLSVPFGCREGREEILFQSLLSCSPEGQLCSKDGSQGVQAMWKRFYNSTFVSQKVQKPRPVLFSGVLE